MDKKLKITSRQKQIIIGKLLGDGHLETVNGRTYRLKIEHSYKQNEYVDFLYKELNNLASSKPKIKWQQLNNKIYKKYWFNTVYSGSLRFYGQQFYFGNKKIVPKLIKRWLTPLCFAIWFMDDGSIKSKECQGKLINTQSFSDNDLKKLQEAIESNFNIKTKLRNQKEGKQIYIPALEVGKLNHVIKKHVLPSIQYKLG
jgi:hypothetical protein